MMSVVDLFSFLIRLIDKVFVFSIDIMNSGSKLWIILEVMFISRLM